MLAFKNVIPTSDWPPRKTDSIKTVEPRIRSDTEWEFELSYNTHMEWWTYLDVGITFDYTFSGPHPVIPETKSGVVLMCPR